MDKTVPNVTGLSVEQAKAALAEVGLQARIYGDGSTITAQLPGSGAVVANGSTILLYAGKSLGRQGDDAGSVQSQLSDSPRPHGRTGAVYQDQQFDHGYRDAGHLRPERRRRHQIDHGTVVEVTLVTSDSGMLGRY